MRAGLATFPGRAWKEEGRGGGGEARGATGAPRALRIALFLLVAGLVPVAGSGPALTVALRRTLAGPFTVAGRRTMTAAGAAVDRRRRLRGWAARFLALGALGGRLGL